MSVNAYGLTFISCAEVRRASIPKQIVYMHGYFHSDGFNVSYVGETFRGAERFEEEHDGLRRSLRYGSDTLVFAPVTGISRRKALETIIMFDHRPAANIQPMPTFEAYRQALAIWNSVPSQAEARLPMPRGLLGTAPPEPAPPLPNVFANPSRGLFGFVVPAPADERKGNAFAVSRGLFGMSAPKPHQAGNAFAFTSGLMDTSKT